MIQLWLQTFWKSIFVGIANIIPGVSSGTIAYISGIYFPALEAVHTLTSLKKGKRAALLYLCAVGLGNALGIVVIGRTLSFIFVQYTQEVSIFFAGLIGGSIPFLLTRAQGTGYPRIRGGIYMGISTTMVFLLSYIALRSTGGSEGILTNGNVFLQLMYMVLMSCLAGIVMIIPGVSGSFVLLISGVYPVLLEALRSFDIVPIIVLSLGSLSGIILFAKFMHALMRNYAPAISWCVSGAVIGSCISILLANGAEIVAEFLIFVPIFLAGILGGIFFSRLDSERGSTAGNGRA